jgi:hypothetical protein
VPAELQAVCRKALARDPRDRYLDVASFQAALREYLDHRESRTLASHAQRGLERWRAATAGGVSLAARPRRYAAVSEVIASFHHAQLLWPENEAARDGEASARREWAHLALDAGDLGVAETALEGVAGSEAKDIRARIAVERAGRRRTMGLVRWLGAGLVACQGLLVAALAWFGVSEIERFTRREIAEQLVRLDRTVGAALAGAEAIDSNALDAIADALGRTGGLRIELIGVNGRQLADSSGEEGEPSPLFAEPLVSRTLRGDGEGGVVALEQSDELALVRPWRHEDGTLTGVLVTALPSDVLDGPLHGVLVAGLAALLVSFLLFSALVLGLARRLRISLARVL